ncbi:DUF4153 domain-containing protein [Paenibacillus sp. FSL R7-0331]|uniref:DUF4153 domain-containing protein n=1 Tax=Paenibacillus sp. FSL R7-0331 TaxID=1536773 RepID=UPI0004F7EAA8|nr:DUF4153 domain-containing protein [Paenibacillus sp. FSL R7-0331]AIQ52226.1 hypothetical protein R70331_12410 [Paenibacillus sp. FSL R7-0331]
MNEKVPVIPRSALSALAAALLLAIVHQYLFYGHMPGVSYPIFVVLFYGFMLYYAKEQLRPLKWFDYVWLAAIFLLAMTFMLFSNWFFYGLNLLALPVLILLHTTYLLSYRRPSWSGIQLIGAALEHFFAQGPRHWPTVFTAIRRTGGEGMKSEHKQIYLKVLAGLLLSCPLLLIVVSLLSSADGVFNELLNTFPDLLERISFGEGFGRTLWSVVLGIGLFSYLMGFVAYKRTERQVIVLKEGEPQLEPFELSVDPVIITTVLTAVNAVYVLFVSVQFSYLFGAWEGDLPQGSTYADYARSGFFELIMVTSINFCLLLLSLLALPRAKARLLSVIRILLYILVMCSVVMLYSAYSRLTLYEEAYGYTEIRFLVHAFMIFLGLLLILAAVRISKTDFPLMKWVVALGLLSYVFMNYIGMDRIIAFQNIARYEATGDIDKYHLTGLSWQAVPLLISFSKDNDDLLKQELGEKWTNQSAEAKQEWPSFNLSKHQGQQALRDYIHSLK